jgi:hypothetical protein
MKNEFFLAKGYLDRTAWHRAAKKGQIKVLHKLCDWAEKVLTPDNIKNEFFLAKDNCDRTAWHRAAEKDNYKYYTNCGIGLKMY